MSDSEDTIVNETYNEIMDDFSEDTVTDDILTLDYMISLRMSFIDPSDVDTSTGGILGLPSSEIRIIKEMFYFLKNNNVRLSKIISVFTVLYNHIDPAKTDDVIYLTNRLINHVCINEIRTLSTNILNVFNTINTIDDINTDIYTGDIISPNLYSNFTSNLFTNMLAQNNMNIITSTIPVHDINIPSIFSSFFIVENPRIPEDVKNVVSSKILEENTKVLKFNELSDELQTKYKTCSICIEDFDTTSDVRQLNCSHVFHINCIDPWLLKESYKCPMCRDDTLPHEHIT